MAKVLTDKECAEIIHRAVHEPDWLDDSDAYKHFLERLGELITDHFGGYVSSVGDPMGEKSEDPKSSEGRWCVLFHWDENVPDDGGVFKDYDTDVSVEEWKADETKEEE